MAAEAHFFIHERDTGKLTRDALYEPLKQNVKIESFMDSTLFNVVTSNSSTAKRC